MIVFWKNQSENRTNVGLSRAKHGMYIFGNAPELAQGSKMWANVLQELHESGCVGKGLPMACHQHPDYIQTVDQPGQLQIVSPHGEIGIFINLYRHKRCRV